MGFRTRNWKYHGTGLENFSSPGPIGIQESIIKRERLEDCKTRHQKS
jgi:hypothetical protein